MADSSDERSSYLVVTGWIVLLVLYVVQVVLLVLFLTKYEDSKYGWYSVVFIIAPILTVAFLYRNRQTNGYANEDKEIRLVWAILGAYIVPFVITVATIFITVAKELTKKRTLGINALKTTLCITPGLLILFLQLAISPSYRKPVVSLSIVAALNIFDGIEMLETFLMQNEGLLDIDSATEGVIEFWMQNGGYFNFSSANGTEILKTFLLKEDKHFDLNSETEWCIIIFTCLCFLLSSFGLARNKFEGEGNVKERTKMSIAFSFLEIICINLPFLGIRAYIWKEHKYEAAVFIAKNIVSLVVGAVEIGIFIKVQRDKYTRLGQIES
ncbi:Hypothetical predicted protein [Paramuricea clavata]|uniref:Uncharacterized protein n=1 Tax=Paramuricea clavata TaxID=317549 RepID=A0A6S7LSE9_PARCT|nr:Hypothetical predicted protein [Paramuricea clavata]